jgi:hypothetical protein
MTLNQRIADDMKAAMKNGEKLKLETLRTVRAQFIEFAKRGADKPVTPDDELAIVLGSIKKRKEAIDLYQQAGRKELADQESRELEILQAYLPKQLEREEAAVIIQNIINAAGASSLTDFGKMMGMAMKELKGKLDGAIVQELVKQILGAQ